MNRVADVRHGNDAGKLKRAAAYPPFPHKPGSGRNFLSRRFVRSVCSLEFLRDSRRHRIPRRGNGILLRENGLLDVLDEDSLVPAAGAIQTATWRGGERRRFGPIAGFSSFPVVHKKILQNTLRQLDGSCASPWRCNAGWLTAPGTPGRALGCLFCGLGHHGRHGPLIEVMRTSLCGFVAPPPELDRHKPIGRGLKDSLQWDTEDEACRGSLSIR